MLRIYTAFHFVNVTVEAIVGAFQEWIFYSSRSQIHANKKAQRIRSYNITGGLKESEIPLNRRITCIQQMYTKATIGKRQEVQSMAC